MTDCGCTKHRVTPGCERHSVLDQTKRQLRLVAPLPDLDWPPMSFDIPDRRRDEDELAPCSPHAKSGPEHAAAWVRYLRLDTVAGTITGYLHYRLAATRCFFSAPRLGHDFREGGLVQHCSRCPKVWVGNL